MRSIVVATVCVTFYLIGIEGRNGLTVTTLTIPHHIPDERTAQRLADVVLRLEKNGSVRNQKSLMDVTELQREVTHLRAENALLRRRMLQAAERVEALIAKLELVGNDDSAEQVGDEVAA